MLRRRLRSVAALAALAVLAALTVLVGIVTVAPASGGATERANLPTLRAPLFDGANVQGSPAVSGPISSPGGPYLYDRAGRVVFFHGVDAVYKHPPFVLYPDPGKPWNFSAQDASLMARLGFNVVRLGMTWGGLEPGTASANDPAICDPGAPHDPGQFNQSVLNAYIGRLQRTVDLLGRFHIYTILDMHQDVYNQMFDGEGSPNWAVCTNGVKSIDPPGRWSLEYGTEAAGIAFSHFWRNNVRGDLQGQFDRVWGDVARAFRTNPWILGYDPYNEPFSKSLVRFGDEEFDAQLECFYTGTAHVGAPSHGAPALHCPRHDPAQGVVATILANDPHHLVFVEPDNFASRGFPTYLGPMDFPHVVYNVHIYCGARSPVTGNPTDIALCVQQDMHSLNVRAEDRSELASAAQRGGPAWFVSEFGASSDPSLLASVTAAMDGHQVSWVYWAWRYYGDPTGSAAESLVMADGRLRTTARVLSGAYPQAVAGVPLSYGYEPVSGTFRLSYLANHRVHAPTVIFVPTQVRFAGGYCTRASGARVTSSPGSDLLEVQNRARAHRVTVTVSPGACAR